MNLLAIILLAAFSGCVSAKPEVSPTLLKAIQQKGPQDIAIIVSHETTTHVISTLNKKSFSNSDEKTTALAQALKQATQASQREILQLLSQYKSAEDVQAYYITDRIFVKKVTAELLHLLSTRHDIAEIREPKIMSIGSPISEKEDELSAKVLEWGVMDIYAPEAWAAGYTGNGVRVSNIDTGARFTHSVLRDGYIGDDSYGWYDPDNRSPSSADDNGHGTHTLGTIAGRTGMGVAPNATWSACLGCPAGACPESALIGCGQWTFCPTLTDGTGEDCSQRPKISSNSWAGGNDDPFYNDVIDSWNEAGIIPVFAIGNAGPGCRTANSPGDQPGVISVGATDSSSAVASFSSHGPSAVALRIKPEVSAPGVNIRSASHRGDELTAILSGTSMATPHVAGAIAVLLEKNPDATRAELATALQDSALKPPIDTIVCTGGGVNATNPWPNNSFGHGKINLLKALDLI